MTLPFAWDSANGVVSKLLGWLKAGLDPGQFTLRVRDWDIAGWKRTQSLVDAGRLSMAQIAYVKLEVANAPGVWLMKVGGILIAVGAGWGVLVRRWLARRPGGRSAAAA